MIVEKNAGQEFWVRNRQDAQLCSKRKDDNFSKTSQGKLIKKAVPNTMKNKKAGQGLQLKTNVPRTNSPLFKNQMFAP